MSPLIKFTYYISIVFLLANLFFAYYQFPDFVAIGFSDNIGLKEYQSKGNLFYMGAGVFLVFNIVIIIFKRLIQIIPFGVVYFPNKQFWLESNESREFLIKIFITWTNSFAVLFNMLIGYVFLSLYIVNVLGFGSFTTYYPLVYIIMILISLWWLVLIFRLKYKKLAI